MERIYPGDARANRIGRAAEMIASLALEPFFLVTPTNTADSDRGADLLLRLRLADTVTAMTTFVQVKGSGAGSPRGDPRVRLRLSTLNFLNGSPSCPALLLYVYVQTETIHWTPLSPLTLIRPRLATDHEAVWITIPRSNELIPDQPATFAPLLEYVRNYARLFEPKVRTVSPATLLALQALFDDDGAHGASTTNRTILNALTLGSPGATERLAAARAAAERNLAAATFTELHVMESTRDQLWCIDREIDTRTPEVWESDELLRLIFSTGARISVPSTRRRWVRIFVTEHAADSLVDDVRFDAMHRALQQNHLSGFDTLLATPAAFPPGFDANLSDVWLVPGRRLCLNPPPAHFLRILDAKDGSEARTVVDYYTDVLGGLISRGSASGSGVWRFRTHPITPSDVRTALELLAMEEQNRNGA